MSGVAVVLGTRPEIIKLAGVIDELADDAVVVHTGQHYDQQLSRVFFDQLRLRPPDHQLGLGGLSRAAQIGRGTAELGDLFAELRPRAVVVQGDTNSALAGALAANAADLPLVHVEAGLRSHDRRMPEEHNRVLIDHIADLLAAPTIGCVDNLALEGIAGTAVICCGNTVVEAVHRQLPDAAARLAALEQWGLRQGAYVLATVHRPENTDDPGTLAQILRQLAALPIPVVAPLHPRTVAAAVRAHLQPELACLQVLQPLHSAAFLALAKEAAVVVSDSGGVQEEMTVLGRPLVVVRRTTERPEAIRHGATLVRPDEISRAVATVLDAGEPLRRRLEGTPSPYGDGTASATIVREIRTRFATPSERASTVVPRGVGRTEPAAL